MISVLPWLAGPATDGGWLSIPAVQAGIAAFGAIAVALITVTGAQMAKRSSRTVDQATAQKLEAETRKTAAETTKTELEYMRSLIDEVREWSELRLQKQQLEHEHALQIATAKVRHESTVQMAEMRATHESEVKAINARIQELEDRYNRAIAMMLAHAPWDTDALAYLRQHEPHWPSPPRLEGHPDDRPRDGP